MIGRVDGQMTQVVAGDAAYPLLGTHLLAGRRLVIDYPAGTVELT